MAGSAMQGVLLVMVGAGTHGTSLPIAGKGRMSRVPNPVQGSTMDPRLASFCVGGQPEELRVVSSKAFGLGPVVGNGDLENKLAMVLTNRLFRRKRGTRWDLRFDIASLGSATEPWLMKGELNVCLYSHKKVEPSQFNLSAAVEFTAMVNSIPLVSFPFKG
ncbi:hypothetical protein NE237_005180 [Protea cynaroides]|uniref:Uncharacterized protein n=1 Tax=Protea cynaroides TaxID=273540 RepID=A0A9Q0KKW4_9MAGN|nr:hypothetical protein NE237_005180 [Protea cynaroides]